MRDQYQDKLSLALYVVYSPQSLLLTGLARKQGNGTPGKTQLISSTSDQAERSSSYVVSDALGAEQVATRGHSVPLGLSTLDLPPGGAPCRFHYVDLLTHSLPHSQGRKAIPSGGLVSVGA